MYSDQIRSGHAAAPAFKRWLLNTTFPVQPRCGGNLPSRILLVVLILSGAYSRSTVFRTLYHRMRDGYASTIPIGQVSMLVVHAYHDGVGTVVQYQADYDPWMVGDGLLKEKKRKHEIYLSSA